MPRLACLLAFAACWFASPATAQEPNKKPNILFLFSDDQRADTIAALGNPNIRTPNLDALVRRGMTFTRAYCMGSLQPAVCVPSRAMLLSGRTLFRIKDNLDGITTWPEVFARSGYVTFVTGKWHNQQPSLLRSFQMGKAVFFGGMGDPYKLQVADISDKKQVVGKRSSDKHSIELFADSAIDFVKKHKGPQPFVAYVPFNAPHDPRVAPPKYHEMYDPAKLPLPANYLPQHPFDNGEMKIRDEKLAPWPRTPEVVRKHLADYYAAITFMDDQIGRILDALRETGQLDNTIIVFCSDHGLALGSHGLFGKQNLYDHSMRTPLIFAGPGIPKDKKSDAMCYLLDLFPTLGAMAGMLAPPGSDGKSLVPVLQEKTTRHRDAIFLAYMKVQRAVRDDRWKIIVYPHLNKTQLFDLKTDPDEKKDLAADPAHAAELKRLRETLQKMQQDLGDKQPLSIDKSDSAGQRLPACSLEWEQASPVCIQHHVQMPLRESNHKHAIL